MADKQKVSLKIDVHTIPLEINKNEEEDYRKAVAFLNERFHTIKKSRSSYSSSEMIWIYVALECCANLMSDERDKAVGPIYSIIDDINKKIEKVLGGSSQTQKSI